MKLKIMHQIYNIEILLYDYQIKAYFHHENAFIFSK